MRVNGEAVYATRPWKVYRGGPSTQASERGKCDGQSDTQSKPFTPEVIRFTQARDGRCLYASVLAFPVGGLVTIKSLASNCAHWRGDIAGVQMLGSGPGKVSRDATGLHDTLPRRKPSHRGDIRLVEPAKYRDRLLVTGHLCLSLAVFGWRES